MCRPQTVYQGMHSTWLSTMTGAKSGHWISVQIAVFFLNFHYYYFKSYFIYLTVLGLCYRALLSWSKQESLFIAVHELLTVVASLVTEHGLLPHGLGSCGAWHVASSQTRDRTSVTCTGRQILSHWTTREVLTLCFILYDFSLTPFSLLYS